MSEDRDMDTEEIYVRLLNEGTEVFRPVLAKKLAGGRYKIIKKDYYDPEDEEWEFPPGSIVGLVTENRDGKILNIAAQL